MSKSVRPGQRRLHQVNRHATQMGRYVMVAGKYQPTCGNCWGFERVQTRDSFQNLIVVQCPVCQTAPLAVAR